MEVGPLVSVLMTAYNREKYITEAIESVLASSYTNFELIIVDDRSSDGTVAIARKFEQADSRVHVYVNEHNLGDYPNRNKAASYAKGKYLKYVDSDDVLYPFGLSIMVSRMESNPSAALGLAKRSWRSCPFPILLTPAESYRCHFIEGKAIFSNAPTSAIINHSKFKVTGGFSGLNQYGDYEYWLKVASQYSIILMEGDVTWDRDHEVSEKYKDDVYSKSILNHKISTRCLELAECPLSDPDKELAIKKIKQAFIKLIIKMLLYGKFRKGIFLLSSM